jgi:hypothetical protein
VPVVGEEEEEEEEEEDDDDAARRIRVESGVCVCRVSSMAGSGRPLRALSAKT